MAFKWIKMGASQVLQSNSELAASRCRRSRYLERGNWKTGFVCNMFGIARLSSFLQVRIPQRRVQSTSITGYWGSRFLERNCVSWNLNQEIQIQFTFYYFWLILQLSSECGWCCYLFSEKKSWEVRISQRYDHRFLGHIQNRKKRTSLHLWLNPKQGAPRRWIFLFSWFLWVRISGRWQSRRRRVCSLRPPRKSFQIRGQGRWTRGRSWGPRRRQRVSWGAGWCTCRRWMEDVVCCKAGIRLRCCSSNRPAKLPAAPWKPVRCLLPAGLRPVLGQNIGFQAADLQ